MSNEIPFLDDFEFSEDRRRYLLGSGMAIVSGSASFLLSHLLGTGESAQDDGVLPTPVPSPTAEGSIDLVRVNQMRGYRLLTQSLNRVLNPEFYAKELDNLKGEELNDLLAKSRTRRNTTEWEFPVRGIRFEAAISVDPERDMVSKIWVGTSRLSMSDDKTLSKVYQKPSKEITAEELAQVIDSIFRVPPGALYAEFDAPRLISKDIISRTIKGSAESNLGHRLEVEANVSGDAQISLTMPKPKPTPTSVKVVI